MLFPFINSYVELRDELGKHGCPLPLSEDLSVLSKPLTFGQAKKYTVPNRFLVQPMEGFDSSPEGAPT